jgi:hypothetical protein
MMFVAIGTVAGALLAVRHYPFFLLLPVMGVLSASALLIGIAYGSDPNAIAVEVLGSAAATQLVYLAALAGQFRLRPKVAHVSATHRRESIRR